MPKKSYREGFGDSDTEIQPYERQPLISDNIQQTLTRILGWNELQKRWRMLVSDADGRLLVSSSPSKSSTGQISHTTLDTTVQNTLVSNPNRKIWRIINQSNASIKVAFENSIGASNFFTLAAGGSYSDENYTGGVWVQGTGTGDVEAIEI